MCTCKHGSDRLYLDYAGPGICGGILSRCLEQDCPCALFKQTDPGMVPYQVVHPVVIYHYAGIVLTRPQWTSTNAV